MYKKYFQAAEQFLKQKGLSFAVADCDPLCEEEILAHEKAMGARLPEPLRLFVAELGDSFYFTPASSREGFQLSPLLDLESPQSFAQEIFEDLEGELNSEKPRNPPDKLRAEAERRSNWLPFYNIGGGGYLLCIDLNQKPHPIRFHEAVYWRGVTQDLWDFVLAESFEQFIANWSRYCFLGSWQ